MSEKIDPPSGTIEEIKIKRITTATAMRYTQPAVNQPSQKTVPGKDSADTPS
jgi:hypothetical protein